MRRGTLIVSFAVLLASLVLFGEETKPSKAGAPALQKPENQTATAQPRGSDRFVKNLLSQAQDESDKCSQHWICVQSWTTTKPPRPGVVVSGCYRISTRCGCNEQNLGKPMLEEVCFGIDER